MKTFSQFIEQAYGNVRGITFARRTPTSAELKAAQTARANTQGTTRQKELAAVRAGVTAGMTPSAPQPPTMPKTPATPAPVVAKRPVDIRNRDINARGSFDPRFDKGPASSTVRRSVTTPAAQTPPAPADSSTAPGSPEDDADIRKAYPGFGKYGLNPSLNPRWYKEKGLVVPIKAIKTKLKMFQQNKK